MAKAVAGQGALEEEGDFSSAERARPELRKNLGYWRVVGSKFSTRAKD